MLGGPVVPRSTITAQAHRVHFPMGMYDIPENCKRLPPVIWPQIPSLHKVGRRAKFPKALL